MAKKPTQPKSEAKLNSDLTESSKKSPPPAESKGKSPPSGEGNLDKGPEKPERTKQKGSAALPTRCRMLFRLAELVNHVQNDCKRPGLISDIVKHTGLDRHQVSSLLRNRVKNIPLATIGVLCEYLVEHHWIPPHILPGALFRVAPDEFWELLARRRVLLVTAARRPADDDWTDGALVRLSDSMLQGTLLTGITTLGGARKFREVDPLPGVKNAMASAAGEPSSAAAKQVSVHSTESIRESHVWATPRGETEVDRQWAMKVWEQYTDAQGDRGIIAIGSNKSNAIAELIIASIFGCDPFVGQDDVAYARQRKAPIMFRYRPDDPHPASCAAGERLSKSEPAVQSGIWYELPNGRWDVCPWNPSRLDAALVLWRFSENTGMLEMVAAGYSGRATRLLARTLNELAPQLFPEQYRSGGLTVGAFLVKYELGDDDSQARDILRNELEVKKMEVIPLDPSVLERRLGKPSKNKAAPAKASDQADDDDDDEGDEPTGLQTDSSPSPNPNRPR